MAQPLYFLPGLSRAELAPSGPLRKAILAERGLAQIFEGVTSIERDCTLCEISGRGPSDLSGSILAYQRSDGAIPRRIGYYAGEQSWTPVGDGNLLWIGTDTSEPPTPADLRRPKAHSGYPINLAGAVWLIPVIRRPDGSTELPQDYYWDSAGLFQKSLKETYRTIWDRLAEVADWYFTEGGFDSPTFSLEKAVGLSIDVLGLNYRFGRNEQSLLRVIDSENWSTILACAVDVIGYDAVTESAKKNSPGATAESLNTFPGSQEEALPTGTDPAVASSA